jgi:XapX domain-containing protein
MKVYLLSLGAGLLVGVIYYLLNVRSPALPLVALVGLLGSGRRADHPGRKTPADGIEFFCRLASLELRFPHLRHAARSPDRWACRRPRDSGEANMNNQGPDLILHHGQFTTLDRSNPAASAVAIKDGVFTAVGQDGVMKLAGQSTNVIDLKERCVLPGLIDNHLHIIRGGLNFNMELRWDGVWSLADAMAMLKKQVAITPPPPMGARGRWLH